MTFSLAARCARTGMLGAATVSSSPAVAARCAYARAGVGAVLSQNVTDPRLGPRALDLMAGGMGAPDAVALLRTEAAHPEYRQILAIDAEGRTATHSGPKALGVWSDAAGRDVIAGGNLLAHEGVPAAIVAGFEAADGALGDRLLLALQAGLLAGGEAGPVHSAGMVIAHRESWPYADLRCDWTLDDPVEALAAAWAVYAHQADAYVQRALDPRAAPAFGVAGDE